MTTEQKDRIVQLRASGKGYKRIAESLGISVSTVKSYCQRNGLTAVRPEPLPQPDKVPDNAHILQGEADSSACVQSMPCLTLQPQLSSIHNPNKKGTT